MALLATARPSPPRAKKSSRRRPCPRLPRNVECSHLGTTCSHLGNALHSSCEGILRIFSRAALVAFWKRYPDAEQPLKAWHQEVEHAAWRGPADVRARYGTADFVANNRVIFDIRGKKYRLIAAVKYGPLFCVYVRFVGTHAEYDRIDPATI